MLEKLGENFRRNSKDLEIFLDEEDTLAPIPAVAK
jgi:hypothetical protein